MAEPTVGTAAPPTDQTTATPGAVPPPGVERESVIDAAADLLQLFVQFIRQETEALVRDKIGDPLARAGAAVAFAFAAAFVLVLGICFLVAAELILLAQWITWPGSLALNGAVLIAGAAGLTYARMRKMR